MSDKYNDDRPLFPDDEPNGKNPERQQLSFAQKLRAAKMLEKELPYLSEHKLTFVAAAAYLNEKLGWTGNCAKLTGDSLHHIAAGAEITWERKYRKAGKTKSGVRYHERRAQMIHRLREVVVSICHELGHKYPESILEPIVVNQRVYSHGSLKPTRLNNTPLTDEEDGNGTC